MGSRYHAEHDVEDHREDDDQTADVHDRQNRSQKGDKPHRDLKIQCLSSLGLDLGIAFHHEPYDEGSNWPRDYSQQVGKRGIHAMITTRGPTVRDWTTGWRIHMA